MQITIDEKKEYWDRVRDSLKIIGSENVSIEKLRMEIQALPVDDQILFYHSEPIDIAKDLARLTHLNPGHDLAYLALSEKRDSDLSKARDEGKKMPHREEGTWRPTYIEKPGSFLHQLIIETAKQTSEISFEIAEENYRSQRKLLTAFSIFTVILASGNLLSLASTLIGGTLGTPINFRLIINSVVVIVSILSLVGIFLLLPKKSKKVPESKIPTFTSRTRYQVRGSVKAN